MTRLRPLPPEELRADQREQFDRIAATRKPDAAGQLGGPFDPWVRSPEVARRMYAFGGYLWARTTLGRRLVEVAILTTGRFWESDFEWWAHVRLAKEAGVDERTITGIFDGDVTADAPADERLVWEAARSLHETHRIPDDLYGRFVDRFGEEGLVEMIATAGYYTFVSMTLNAFEIDMPPGVERPFAQ
jgi:4-carboxymuconolactone decarboxylase